MGNPMISVIVPVYKVEKYLRECIDSILNQTYTDYELILVDDGSPDRCPEICDEYTKRDNRVKAIHKTNAGVSSARNTGIEFSQGEYIAFVDADDSMDADFLEQGITALESSKLDVYISGVIMEMWYQEKIVHFQRYSINKSAILSVKELMELMEIRYPQICICGPCCKIYKSSIIKENNIRFDVSLCYGEDTCFNLAFFNFAKAVFFSDQCFYHYRRDSADSLYSKFHKDTYEVHQNVYGKMRKLMVECGCDDPSMQRFENLYFSLLVGGIHEYYKFYQQTDKKEKVELMKKIANDKFIQGDSLSTISSRKNKLLFILLKFKLFGMIHLFFDIYYGAGKSIS